MITLENVGRLLTPVFCNSSHKNRPMTNTTKRSSGNWGPQQDKQLGDLLCSNQVNYRDRTAEYLFGVTEKYFPTFVTPGASGRNSAIQRMQGKFV
jgi:hypothetical protein